MHDGPFNSFREVVDPHLWGCLEAFAHWPNTRSEQGYVLIASMYASSLLTDLSAFS